MQISRKDESRGFQMLTEILEDAVDSGADSVRLEYVSEGLEVSYMFGNAGLGSVITDPEVEREIIRYIVENARLEKRPRGRMQMDLLGKQYTIMVEEFDHFGESAFKLSLKKSK